MTRKFIFTLLAYFALHFSLFTQNVFAQTEARLMRFPTVHDDQVVFSYAGDLYTVSKSGGTARRLTSDVGFEMFSKFSPDGKTIAFTGQYDGNTEVFTIPSEGGEPKRLTYTATLGRDDVSDRMGPNNIVMTWKDNSHIVYRSRKESFNDFQGHLFIANVNGGLSDELPVPRGGFCSYSPDGKKMALNRIFREFRTWKYYKGGMADDVWIYDFDTKQTTNITNTVAQDIEPMWAGNKIYYLSDRDRTMNLFCYDLTTKETRKITTYTDFDIKFASLGNKDITWERGGFLYVMDLATETISKVTVTLEGDFPDARTEWIDGTKFIEGWDASPDARRLTFVSRGDVFTVPSEEGITHNLDKSSSSHERNATWSPDGKWIAYISDATGEDEIYMRSQAGDDAPIQITKNADTYKFELTWSPDSKKILWGDKKLRLQYVNVDTKEATLVEQSQVWEMRDFSWSPDSKWIAYTRPESNSKSKIILFGTEAKNKIETTDGWYDVGSPVFSRDGKFLLLTSSRDFNPSFSGTDFEIAYNDMSKIYLLPLSADTKSPFAPVNDEVEIKKDETVTDAKTSDKKSTADKPADKKEETVTVKIDAAGIQDRLIALPGDAGNYWNIEMLNNKVYYQKNSQGKDAQLYVYDLKKKKETAVGDYNTYRITANGEKMVVTKSNNYYVIDVPSGKADVDEKVDISGLKVYVNHTEEWAQIFNESWRQMKYFFYAPNMHGVDWDAIKTKYEVLVPYVKHRADLTYIIGEMIGELTTGHSYVGGGDMPKPERIKMGLLGAGYVRDASGYFKITNILQGANWSNALRSPLTEVGVNIKAGEFIIAINGQPTNKVTDINQLLVGTADKQTELTINSTASTTGSRKVLVVPIADEKQLRYYNWVEHNIHYVDSVSNGKIGYLHIPNMGVDGLNEFIKHYYPQITRKALIVDDRGNGGGFVSPLIADRLSEQLVYFSMVRNVTVGTTNPEVFYGPKVCLVNEYSASDGDIFPYRFRSLKLGKIIGKRTWGGIVGIRGSLPFVDGGFMDRPEFTSYTADGFAIEGYGVDPDVVVDNDPAKEYAGIDEQLDVAIKELLDQLKTQEKNIPPVPPFPDKSK